MKRKVLKVNEDDNVLVALTDLSKGETIAYNGDNYSLQDDIKAKHKFFTKDMQPGDKVIMYGVLVGTAQQFIPKGGWMNTGNVKHAAAPYLMGIIAKMEMLALPTIGYLFQLFFVRIEILM
jgi:altronate hydrolase